MTEYINRETVRETIQKMHSGDDLCRLPSDIILDDIWDRIKQIKSEPVMPCASGHWKLAMNYMDELIARCSECYKDYYRTFNYCPNCGAMMVKD